MSNIIIKGAEQNNLKGFDIEIPRNKIVVFTGVSGSGKSSLVFQTINAEAQRQLYDTFSSFARSRLPKYEQPAYDVIENLSPTILMDQKRFAGNARSTVGTTTEIYTYLRLLYSRIGVPSIGASNLFSFNTPEGMCNECSGTGKVTRLDVNSIVDWNKSINEGAIVFEEFRVGTIYWKQVLLSNLFDFDKPLKEFSDQEIHDFLYAKSIRYKMGDEAGFMNGNYEGIYRKICRLYLNKDIASLSKKKQDIITRYINGSPCNVCGGARINQGALTVKVNRANIHELSQMQLTELYEFMQTVKDETVFTVTNQIIDRLSHLIHIGVGYLNLSRETGTLSGGEAQRVKLAKQLGCSLTEMLYILDEPSVGLHPRDVHLVNELLQKLRDNGNTVLVVEHDPDVIKIADHVVDVGPMAGSKGGEIVFEGTYEKLKDADTITAQYLNLDIVLKENVRGHKGYYAVNDANTNNLKNISVEIPKGVLTCITGVAGSGKSSLIHKEFLKQHKGAIVIDQAPVGQSERSIPATYTGVFDLIRKLFAKHTNGTAPIFSFNSTGACPSCNGLGYITIEMAFLDSVKSTCETCKGIRYKDEVLKYRYQNKTIVDVLDMTINQARVFFTDLEIKKRLQLMVDVGLGYLKLGQPLSTLSGGECQRIKLSRELHKNSNIYVLDEPTTGLHMSDIKKVNQILDRLVDNGNTVVVIEHNLDVICNADWIIDIGPEGGVAGGEVVVEGTPKSIVTCENSFTAKYLSQYFRQ
ncbi:excinuclease ABC subunit UvrA [Halosquirtibacter xylanolyticus]|uniref:ATP-binding cassette domain-containing protein n=1 Tax=Halosquirtibacter xylanolyticus TaxID=3374599 RepID=UPI003749A3A8|nr:excinuclease ABC subunit UvrA [Prolixibacteraceae bacterium]